MEYGTVWLGRGGIVICLGKMGDDWSRGGGDESSGTSDDVNSDRTRRHTRLGVVACGATHREGRPRVGAS